MGVSYSYGICSMKDMKVKTVLDGKKVKASAIIMPSGEEVVPTKRFWKSFQMRWRLNDTAFSYWTHEEVFERISKVKPNDKIRWSVERVEKPGVVIKPRAMAVSNPNNPFIKLDKLLGILEENQTDFNKDGTAVTPSYSDGFIRSRHVPSRSGVFDIAGDSFQNRFYIDTPVDGFGRPQIYVGLLREVCSNGAVAFSPAFRSEVTIGKKNDSVEFALGRMLGTFNSEDGYLTIKQRFTSAAKSWASVSEAMRLHKMILKVYQRGGLAKSAGKLIIGDKGEATDTSRTPIMEKFMALTGNLNQIYGTANIDSLSDKKQKTLPASCKVYDLLNFTSEVATHYATPSSARTLHSYIGSLLSAEYDLENTCDQFADYKDFFIGNSRTADTIANLNMAT